MEDGESLLLETDRLLLRDAVSGDLVDLQEVFASNADFLAMRREFARYDLEAVARYWDAAVLDPVRHIFVVVDKRSRIVIGLVDFVDQSPADDMPWIGLVMVRRDQQRQGYAREAVQAIKDLVASRGHGGVRMAVMEDNEAGSAFALELGFAAYHQSDAGQESAGGRLSLMEVRVEPGVG